MMVDMCGGCVTIRSGARERGAEWMAVDLVCANTHCHRHERTLQLYMRMNGYDLFRGDMLARRIAQVKASTKKRNEIWEVGEPVRQ